MKELFRIVPVLLYFLTGLISLVMALKCLFARQMLPFQELASAMTWNQIDERLRTVILTLLRLSGLGFLMASILLTVCPVVNFIISPGAFYTFFSPGLALLFGTGLFLFNYLLFSKTKADAPWKESLCVMCILAAGIIISAVSG
jgi:hypothetical protein